MCYVREVASDGSIKLTFASEGRYYYSVVFVRDDGTVVVVASSQIGCPVGCEFCCVGQEGFFRNLTTDEIEEQIIACLKEVGQKDPTRVVFAGAGDPTINWANVSIVVERLTRSGFSVSLHTPGIRGFFETMLWDILNLPGKNLVDLRISIHFPFRNERKMYMSGASGYSLQRVLGFAQAFSKKGGNKPVLNYVLFEDKNDTLPHFSRLAKLAIIGGFTVKLSVANYANGDYSGSPEERRLVAEGILRSLGVNIRVENTSHGTSLGGGMGQLNPTVASVIAGRVLSVQ